ncbi:hypothetical protein BDZ97DRAFT_1901797 [Flammula alnicola]|nr:hypothetical protein BDZ97DRAFT_1901797 [Flammula alnicola]
MAPKSKKAAQCQVCLDQNSKYTCPQCRIAKFFGRASTRRSNIPSPLTSLKWPYVPDESAFPDPLKRDDPKTMQLSQYEAISTSPAIRKILTGHKNLPDLLTSIDKLRGVEREQALQRALGVTAPEIDDQLRRPELSEDVLALRELAEAIEAAVRGANGSALGLNWGDE